jgi:hypothetical protein
MKCPLCNKEVYFRLRLCTFHGDRELSDHFVETTTLRDALKSDHLLDKDERPSVQGGKA